MALWRNLCFPSVNARVVDGAAIEPTAPMTVVVEGGYIRSAVEDTPQSSSSCGLFSASGVIDAARAGAGHGRTQRFLPMASLAKRPTRA
jgi:hypothetical protein